MRRFATRIGYILSRVGRRIVSRQKWLILMRDLSEHNALDVGSELSIRRGTPADAKLVFDSLPPELVSHLPESMARDMVESRFRKGIPCVLAFQNGTLVGGCWYPASSTAAYLGKPGVHQENTGEITTLFVPLASRGKGYSSAICAVACEQMAAEGIQYCLSLVWYTRPASIKAHLRVGFEPIGEKVTWSFLGLRWTHFRPAVPDGMRERASS